MMMRNASSSRTLTHFISQNARVLLLVFVGILFLGYATDLGSFTRKVPSEGGSASGTCPVFGKRYGIMMDAGSTGSRTHVFEFDFHTDGSIGLVREVFEQVKPGLSSFKDDPKAAANSIVPLMDIAKRDVPPNSVRCTPVALKATAGLRLVGKEKSAAILDEVASSIRSYGFDAPADVAVVMDGRDEGPYAWITVNFLLGNLGAARTGTTAAIMDMGGASTQIVFEPENKAHLADAHIDYIYDATLLGSKHKMYQNSYLGLGLKEAVKTAAKAALKGGKGTSFACLPKDFTFDLAAGETVTNTDGTQNFDECASFISKTLIDKQAACTKTPCSFNGIYQPKLRDVFSGDIYAFSYFYDRMENWLPVSGEITVGTYKTIGQKICDNAKEGNYADHNKGTMCADFAYLYALLTEGYGLADSEKLYIKKKIKGIETAWALGAMIEMMK